MAKHYLEMFAKEDDKYVAAFELKGNDLALTIKSVAIEKVIGGKGREESCPVLHFEEAKKGMVLNKTNAKMVAKLYGTDPEVWVGKTITLYPTTTDYQGETTECIRIRYEFN